MKSGGDPNIADAALSLYWNFPKSQKQANPEKNEASTPKTGSLSSSCGAGASPAKEPALELESHHSPPWREVIHTPLVLYQGTSSDVPNEIRLSCAFRR
jgi:hypothetical protein